MFKEKISQYLTKKPKPLIFDHLPKCAGTTIYLYLKTIYPEHLTYGLSGSTPMNSVREFKKLPKKTRYDFKLVYGHFANKIFDHASPNALRVTVLREPIDRIISHYYYVLRMEDHHLHKTVVEKNIQLENYCSSNLNESLTNWYVLHFSKLSQKSIRENPERAVKKAIENIQNDYDIVGFQDNLLDFSGKLIKKANLPKNSFDNSFHNDTKGRKKAEEISAEALNDIKENNLLDIAFYKTIREIFLNKNE